MQLPKSLLYVLLLFVTGFALLSVFNRLASDDFECYSIYRQHGITGGVKYFYDHWNVRWCAIGALNVIFAAFKALPALWMYHLGCFALLWYGWYRIVLNVGLLNGTSHLQKITLSGCTSVAFFFSSFSISDVFFWINTSTMYLLSVIAFLHAAASILSRRTGIFSLLIIIFCGFYIGGACEPFTMVLIMSIGTLILIRFKKPILPALPTPTLLLFLICLCLSFAITYSGNGHQIRAQFLPQTDIVYKGWALIKSLVKIFAFKIPALLLPALLFSFPWFIAGKHYQYDFLTNSTLKKVTVIFLFLTFASIAPIVFVMSEAGPEGSWTQLSLYLTAYCAVLSAYAGKHSKMQMELSTITRIFTIMMFLFVASSMIPKIREAAIYAKAYDKRMELLNNMKMHSSGATIVEVEPLPSSGWLHSAEISENPKHFSNRHLQKYLEVSFQIKRK